ncbi:dicarboxylate/amino acid:cation symporter [Ligilactobacillus equi]|uniref:dicarboxylate/amino acid:cation symporter n=1 Tax=Ligilactobacillus equi TaxID=137357 RepID=UPI002ED3976B
MKVINKIPFTSQLLIVLVLGIMAGKLLPQIIKFYDLLGTWFLNSITMVVLPLIFPTVTLAVVEIFKQRNFGRVLAKVFIYFFVITTTLIFIFLAGSYFSHLGKGVNNVTSTASIKEIGDKIDLWNFLNEIVPSNIIASFASGSLLSSIVFAIALGLGIGAYGVDKADLVVKFFKAWVGVIYKITDFIIKVSPIGIFGIIAADVTKVGWSSLSSLAVFVVELYVAYIILAVVIFPLIALLCQVSYLNILRSIKDLLSLAFFTGSSSVVLPKLLERLKENDQEDSLSDFIVPLGYTFNLNGVVVYLAVAIAFIANIYEINLTWTTIISLTVLLTFISKTIATVPSGAIVVLLATASQLGLPKEGVALIFAVDFFANAGRTALNVLGNTLAAKILSKQSKVRPVKVLQTKIAHD